MNRKVMDCRVDILITVSFVGTTLLTDSLEKNNET